ncbi:hypothetical protein FMEXI_11427 [Fusarium mexicanum]|uniref:2EXR domain-containing protein n=1 Tax=Fusarium mexicanum TaxID=751941 RepID=A0A8H5IGS2_9HYPO|nr:hypothetical protein FMEXI_11427 [Fusarium mexicanum]
MDTTTFHPFPRLPYELREQIWQDACFQLAERRRNIYYVYMDENRNIWPRDYDWKTDDPSNRFGYTWHSYIWHVGLWTACRESNYAVREFEDLYFGLPRPRRCMRVVSPQKCDSLPRDQVIDLTEDICCINTDSWGSLLRPWEPISLHTDDPRPRKQLKKPRNIGVKFDPSWEEELQKAVENTCFDTVLRDFSPPLAFMIRLLFEVAREVFRGRSKVMLIDDESEWQSFDTEGHGGCRIFDIGQEYVELGYVMGFNFQKNTKDKSLGDVIWFHSEPFPPPVYIRQGLIHRKGDYEPWRQVADMERDIFCVTAESWEPLVSNWKPLYIEAKDECHFIDDVMNVAVEFDPSWYQTIKSFNKDNPISDYPPSLAFLIRLLLDHAQEKEYGKRIQLIDRNVLWHVDNQRLACYPIYVDCDHEYIELWSPAVARNSPLSCLLSLFDRLIGDKLTEIVYGEQISNYSLSESDWEQDDRLSPEELMRFVSMETLEFGLETDAKRGEEKRTSAVPGILVSLQTITQEVPRDVSPPRTETGKDIEAKTLSLPQWPVESNTMTRTPIPSLVFPFSEPSGLCDASKQRSWPTRDTKQSHFNNKKKYQRLYDDAIEKLAEWREKRDSLPEIPAAKTAIEESLAKALEERAAKHFLSQLHQFPEICVWEGLWPSVLLEQQFTMPRCKNPSAVSPMTQCPTDYRMRFQSNQNPCGPFVARPPASLPKSPTGNYARGPSKTSQHTIVDMLEPQTTATSSPPGVALATPVASETLPTPKVVTVSSEPGCQFYHIFARNWTDWNGKEGRTSRSPHRRSP